MKVAILLNTIDRYELTVKCIGGALATAGYPFEFLCCDNGSSDRRVIEYIETLNPVYFRKNERNEGCAQMHNQMLLRTDADLFVLLDNDIEIRGRQHWLKDMVDAYLDGPAEGTGVMGIHSDQLCPEKHQPFTLMSGRVIFPARPPKEDAVFGTRMFSRTVLDKVGFFCEDYGPYSLCDNEYNTRVHHAGFMNYYIDGPSGLHLGWDVGENSEYRRMKDRSMAAAGPVLEINLRKYFETRTFYVPAPELR